MESCGTFASAPGEGMDFERGVTEHLAWKDLLFEYLARPDGRLNPSEIASDQNCTLGKWIHSEETAYADDPEFARLRAEHEQFHKVVANIVRGARLGLSVRNEAALERETEFGKTSANVISALMALKSKAANRGTVPQSAATECRVAGQAAECSPTFAWNPSYSVHVRQCDEHHKYLFVLLQVLEGMSDKTECASTVKIVLDELHDYCDYHFKAEEGLMEQAQYSGLALHREAHRAFTARIAQFKQNQAFSPQASAAILKFMKKWIVDHIQKMDRYYSATLNKAGIH